MRARKRLARSSHRFLELVLLPLLSLPHSTALPSLKRYDKRYEDHSLSRGEPNCPRFISKAAKRCILASVKLGADFSRGCADRGISHLLFATHPYPRLSPRFLCQQTLSNDSHRNESS